MEFTKSSPAPVKMIETHNNATCLKLGHRSFCGPCETVRRSSMIDEVCRGLEILKRRVFLCRQSMPRRFSVKVNRRKSAWLFSLLDSKINERSSSGSTGPRN
jgi:hypothetical protein